MGFELHISCSKDIDELHINFSDGTSSIVGPDDKPKPPTPSTPKPKKPKAEKPKAEKPTESEPVQQAERRPGSHRSEILDIDAEFGGVSQDVIRPPEIQMEERPVKVADELQNFDF